MYYILYLEALSGGPSWVFSINHTKNLHYSGKFAARLAPISQIFAAH